MNEYLTPQELAALTGKTTSAIYQRLKKDLSKYEVIVDGRKMVMYSVLKEAFNIGESKEIVNTSQNIDNTSQVPNNELLSNFNSLTSTCQMTISVLNDQLKLLQEQIIIKDKQIAELEKLHEKEPLLIESKQGWIKRLFNK